MASIRGKCDNCERPDMALRKIGSGRAVCGTCVLAIQGIPEGPERERKLAEVAARIQAGGLDKRKATNRKEVRMKEAPPAPEINPVTAVKISGEGIEAQLEAFAEGVFAAIAKITPYLPAIPAGKVPKEAPKNGNGLFPPLTLVFEERDSRLVDALEAEATKQRRTPDQHILYILEQRYLQP